MTQLWTYVSFSLLQHLIKAFQVQNPIPSTRICRSTRQSPQMAYNLDAKKGLNLSVTMEE